MSYITPQPLTVTVRFTARSGSTPPTITDPELHYRLSTGATAGIELALGSPTDSGADDDGLGFVEYQASVTLHQGQWHFRARSGEADDLVRSVVRVITVDGDGF